MSLYTVVVLITDRELVILGKGSVPFPVCKVHPQLRWVTTLVSQEVHVVQSKPVFTAKVAEATPVVRLVTIKVHAAILSFQQNCPASSVCLHVALHLHWLHPTVDSVLPRWQSGVAIMDLLAGSSKGDDSVTFV